MGLRYKVQALNWFLYQHVNPRLNRPVNYQKLIKLGEYQKICQGQTYRTAWIFIEICQGNFTVECWRKKAKQGRFSSIKWMGGKLIRQLSLHWV